MVALTNFANITLSSLYFDIMKDVLYANNVHSMERRVVVDTLKRVSIIARAGCAVSRSRADTANHDVGTGTGAPVPRGRDTRTQFNRILWTVLLHQQVGTTGMFGCCT